jgi:hypothetical protein
MATTPTSMVNRLMGLETWTDAVNFGSATHIFGGAVSFTGNPTFTNAPTVGGISPYGIPAPVAVAAATTQLTMTAAAHANKVITFASTGGLAITPPAATGTGNIYTFFCTTTVTGGSVTIDAKAGNASDVFAGNALQFKSGTGSTTYGTTATTNLLTFNGTTTGGILGDLIEMIDVGTHLWAIFISGQASGIVATPFSNH